MNQADLQLLTEERLKDARALMRGKRWSFAYYVAGYAVECALKSCLLARMIHTGWVFQEKAKIADCLTHDFDDLVQLAGMGDLLNQKLKESASGNQEFVKNWNIVLQWEVTDRYQMRRQPEAIALFDAITAQPDGVLPWIRKYW